jgi:hypothetical protein
MVESLAGFLKKLTSYLAPIWREPPFTCADCERWQRCGLPPSETCMIKLEQLSRDDRSLQQRVQVLGPW